MLVAFGSESVSTWYPGALMSDNWTILPRVLLVIRYKQGQPNKCSYELPTRMRDTQEQGCHIAILTAKFLHFGRFFKLLDVEN